MFNKKKRPGVLVLGENGKNRMVYADEKNKISKEDRMEVLENIEITEKNKEFLSKMANIEAEMKMRKMVLSVDPDTGEKKESSETAFNKLKQETIKETRKELTKTSKYVKGAVIGGVSAVIMNYIPEFVWGSDLSHIVPAIVANSDQIPNGEFESFLKSNDGAIIAGSLVGFIGTAAYALQKICEAISQEIKTRVASNQKVQRIIAMVAAGTEGKDAMAIVGKETRVEGNSGYNAVNEDFVVKNKNADGGETPEITLREVRKQLDDMGIKRISREKYKG